MDIHVRKKLQGYRSLASSFSLAESSVSCQNLSLLCSRGKIRDCKSKCYSLKPLTVIKFPFAEPDGKEVELELIGGGEAEEEHNSDTPVPSSCDLNCSCLCHLQWPGMKLVWVPVDTDAPVEQEKGEEDEAEAKEPLSGEDGEEWEEYEEEESGECEQKPVADDGEMLMQSKAKFQHSLNILMAESPRRLSDPGPPSVLALAVTRSQSPPIPPKQSQVVQIPIHPTTIEEENIYESTLPVVKPNTCKELDIPLIKVRKPARRSKLSNSSSDPTSEFKVPLSSSWTVDATPPAIPPRIPLTPVHRVGIPLPQPTLEEWRTLKPSSPGGLSPQRAVTQPLISPHRLPPNSKRLSSASLQSLPEKKGPFRPNATAPLTCAELK